MDLKQLFTDDDAVSPVIGVILMVAITVILAAVIGAFVLNIGGNQEAAPQVQFGFAYDTSGTTSTVEISHEGGQTVDSSQLSVGGNGVDVSSCSTASGTYSAGATIWTCDLAGSPGDEVIVTWTAESGDTSQIVGESNRP
ncbi:type IV pilin [Haloarchaeobius sp. HRN-SO-5]|uniref:type IV pilin n=1 Tax=Haloarchaeobius sp. HRN-SO-5 TaxID=3446118 RepID=UPI003EC1252B